MNVEEIMQSIREHVLRQQTAVSPDQPTIRRKIQGKALPTEFYEHLHQATLGYDQINVQLDITSTNVPVIGVLLQRIRYKLHELVLFYVNQTAVKQINVNHHLLEAATILAQEVERLAESNKAK